jgi:hypothetical protein
MTKLICPYCRQLVDAFGINYKEIRYGSVLYRNGYIDWETDEVDDDSEIIDVYVRCTNCLEILCDELKTIDEAEDFSKEFEIILDENNNIKDIGRRAEKVLYKLAQENNVEISNLNELNNFFKLYYNLT